MRRTLAGSGIAGALLLGGLFGGAQLTHTTAHTQAHTTRTSVVATQARQAHAGVSTAISHHTAQVTTVPVSYTVANDYVSMARQAAIDAGISPDAFVRQIQQESGFNPNAGSPAGAEGIAQFMPATAASMGVNPYDPSSALPGAARMMAGLAAQFGGDYAKALAAYNAGPGAVQAAMAQGGGNWLAYMPAETQNYVAIIMG
jgi:soluble lytic murein transglycosylase-like protein